jgi:HEAT repeat protein
MPFRFLVSLFRACARRLGFAGAEQVASRRTRPRISGGVDNLTLDEIVERGRRYLAEQERRTRGEAIGCQTVADCVARLQSPSKDERRQAVQMLSGLAQGVEDRADEAELAVLVNALCTALSSNDDPQIRRLAAKGLGNVGGPAESAVAALWAAAGDRERSVAAQAVRALGKVGPAGVAVLLDLLQGQDRIARRRAAKSLTEADWVDPEGRLATVLTQSLRDRDRQVREAVIKTLRHLGKQARPALPALLRRALHDPAPGVRQEAAFALAVIAPKARATANALARLLDHENSEVRRMVLEAMQQVGRRAAASVPRIIQLFVDSDKKVRKKAIWVLHDIGREAVPALIDCLRDKRVIIRRRALEALGHFKRGTRPAVPALTAALEDSDRDVRCRAAFALGLGRARSAVPDLIRLLRDSAPRLRASAAHALGNIGKAREAVPLLRELLTDPDEDVRWSTAYALEKAGLDSDESLALFSGLISDPSDRVQSLALGVLKEFGPKAAPAVPALIGLLQGRKDVPGEAMRLLAAIGPTAQAAVPGLRLLLHSEDEYTVINAAEALWKINGEADEAMPILVNLLRSRGPGTGAAVSGVFYTMGPAARAAVPALLEALREPDWDLQWAAACALEAVVGPVTPEAIPGLVSALRHPSGRVSGAAANALEKIGPASVPALTGALKDRTPIAREWAADVLSRFGQEARSAVGALGSLLNDTEADVRIWAAIALAMIARKASVLPILVEGSSHPDNAVVRERSVRALGALGPIAKPAVPSLEEALADDDEAVRQAADEVLKRMRVP